jgi:transcriptional regulator with XRE-family HTH domain
MPPANDEIDFREARNRAGMTQAHVAAAACLSVRTVRRAEAGEQIGFEARRSLCAVLGLLHSNRQDAPDVERHLSRKEVHLRYFSYVLFKRVGGLQPILCLTFLLLFFYAPVDVLALPILFPIITLGAYFLARRDGRAHRQALDFVRGQRFFDGTPVDLERRADAMRASYRAELAS